MIGAEGARLLENANAFSSCVGGFKEAIQCPAGVRGWGDPAGAKRRGGSPARPRKAKHLERKSTGPLAWTIF
ncbi:hypothetical protein ABE288_00560 [Bacillus salipaludis]|uniref:hypothetical protein n=1 Tax=Bacillus salipaludis TaxID=2547811 RepID=UPI003D22EFF0